MLLILNHIYVMQNAYLDCLVISLIMLKVSMKLLEHLYHKNVWQRWHLNSI